MSRIIKKDKPQKIKFVVNNYKYTLDVERVLSINIENDFGRKRTCLDMICSSIDCQPCDSGFREDVKALAKQYGYELISIEVK